MSKKLIPLSISLFIAVAFSFFVYKTLVPNIQTNIGIGLIFLIPASIALVVYLIKPSVGLILIAFILIGMGLYVFNIGFNSLAQFYRECSCQFDIIYFSLIALLQTVIAVIYYGVFMTIKNVFYTE